MQHVAYRVNLAIDEILTNTISYGYLALAPERDLEASLEDTTFAGLGLFLVHQMMDSVEYRREEGCNVVTLIKSTAQGDDDAATC